MKFSTWKIIAASVEGTSHREKNAPCQDSFSWRKIGFGEEILIVVASDGAGSALKGGEGARLACQTILQEARALTEASFSIQRLDHTQIVDWIRLLNAQFKILAEKENLKKEDFACTLLLAIIQAETAFFLQIGDGAIVYDRDGEYRLFTVPQQGEYANSTNFVTDEDALDVLKFEKIEAPIEELAIFTDGLQRIALDYQTLTPHSPFIRPMLSPLKSLSPKDKSLYVKIKNLQKQLAKYLDSPKINERTDDDKTLILASRKINNRQ